MRGKWRKAAAVLTMLGMLSAAGGQAMAQEKAKLPERVNKEVSIPAHVAFTSNQHLFLLDGQDKSKAPKQIT
ncbi:hypothetical protein EN829_039120, partial [Mesorhizobium sp. M00.F.Ca.ET.186.01.1.1]